MPSVVVYDACVLYPASLRDLLVRMASAGLVDARWTQAILDEYVRALLARNPRLEAARLARTCHLMNLAVPEAMVHGYEDAIEHLELPDPDDRHVLAAAIASSAGAITTLNQRDFPARFLDRYAIEVLHPDDLVLQVLDCWPGDVCRILVEQSESLNDPHIPVSGLLERLQRAGLSSSVERVRGLLASYT